MTAAANLELAAVLQRDVLAEMASLIEATGGQRSRTVEVHLHRVVLQWSVALEELGHAGERIAPIVLDAPPATTHEMGEAIERGTLRAMTAILVGDMVLDALAWAELDRRGLWPKRRRLAWVPSPWGLFAASVSSEDPMHFDVVTLDLTLCVARDALIAHQDPLAFPVPSFSQDGDVRLALTGGPERVAAATRELQRIQAEVVAFGRAPAQLLREPEGDSDAMSLWWPLLDHTLALPTILTATQREAVKEAQKMAGFESPPMSQMAAHVVALIRRHLELRRAGQVG